MADKITQNLQKIEELVVKLINKQPRKDLDYTVQASVNSTHPKKVTYAVQITPPAEGLAPVTFIKDSVDELCEAIKAATKHIDYKEIEKAYHKAQIEACKRTIIGHEERIAKLDEPEEELEDVVAAPIEIDGANDEEK